MCLAKARAKAVTMHPTMCLAKARAKAATMHPTICLAKARAKAVTMLQARNPSPAKVQKAKAPRVPRWVKEREVAKDLQMRKSVPKMNQVVIRLRPLLQTG
jgi:hypothetical protein